MRDELFGATVHKAHEWVNEVAKELGTEDKHRAYHALRVGLQALRDRLPDAEAAQLAAQLPLLLRGVFYEGYRPTETPVKERTLPQFLELVAGKYPGSASLEEARDAFVATAAVLNRHVTEGELEDVKAVLPAEIRELWPDNR